MKNQSFKSDYDQKIREIKALDMASFVGYYGFKVHRGGFIVCPFHAEKSASLKIYPHSFYCFGCDTGGDIIGFIMKFFSLDFKEAVEKISEDFYL